ncbi:serine--tRNA ligase [Vibrio jasicida]|uniref:serine--tRNA ligase n=1 Tax=Vibrio jasicida TaxID=766224 RepID=UPI000D4297D3|nr:serine--tRNA ligase [Vibrio jasicida]PQJ44598.1 serine--tRNA ligase [Vibrio jasicida]
MLEVGFIHTYPEEVIEICKNRGININIPRLIELDIQRKKHQTQLDALNAQSNTLAKNIQSVPVEEKRDLIEKGSQLKKERAHLESEYHGIKAEYEQLLSQVPNNYAEDTPLALSDEGNVELEVFGRPPEMKFDAKNHMELGQQFGLVPEASVRVAGSGFPLMRGAMAALENAVLRFTFDNAVAQNFTPCSVPLLIKPDVLTGLGFNPRRDDDGTEIFSLERDNLSLAGTAEVSLVGQYSGEVINSNSLPVKHVALTPCFRREGSYGRRDAGLYRNKMFNKVELVALTLPEKAEEMLQTILEFEKSIFTSLDIHFRIIRICSGDLGAPAFKKYDVEGWMRGRGSNSEEWGWGELTSCSNCTDYQTRRLKIRHSNGQGKPQVLHSLNGTGITTRALICILEQNQTEDGDVVIPAVLQPYLFGATHLSQLKEKFAA